MKTAIILCVIIGMIVVVLIGSYITMFNRLKTVALKVDEAESGIDVALTKRYDVLTKMLDIVKEYEHYEQETILQTVQLRNGMSMKERNLAEREMNRIFSEVKLTAEAYPQLQATAAFQQLQNAVMDTEEHLQAARRAYNANVTIYNTKIVTFPSSIVSGMIGYTKKEYFEADSAKRQDVQMKF